MPIHEQFLELKHRLQQVSRSVRTFQWIALLSTFVGVIFALLIGLPLLGQLGLASSGFRWTVALAGVATLFLALWYCVIVPAMRFLQRDDNVENALARRVGALAPDVRDRFANALQIYEEAQTRKVSPVKQALAGAALQEVYKSVSALPFENVVDKKTPKQRLLFGTGVMAVGLLVWGFAPGFMNQGLFAIIIPNRDLVNVAVTFSIQPGDTVVVKGEDLFVTATTSTAAPQGLTIEWQGFAGGAKNRTEMKRPGVPSAGSFSHRFASVRESFAYRVQQLQHTSAWHNVTVVEPPSIESLQLTVTPPAYTGRGAIQLDENLGDVSALPGSRVQLRLTSNQNLVAGFLEFGNSQRLALQLQGKKASAEFFVKTRDQYIIRLKDQQELENPDPIVYRIETEIDQPPSVEIVVPGADVDLDESMRVPLLLTAHDDYGFSKLEIVYELIPTLAELAGIDSGRWAIPLTNKSQEQINAEALWELSQLNLQPDDVVRYHAEIFDNDAVSGPKVGRSETFRIRFPSLYELYEEVAAEQEQTTEDLSTLHEKATRIKENVEELIRELQKENNVNWEQKQRASESLAATEQMQQDLQSVQENLDEMIQSMERNDLMSLETLEKYMELQQLLQEIDSPELKQAMQDLQKAMENLNPDQLQEALKDFQFSQEEFRKSIERTLNLLKELMAEQKLDEALKKTEDLLARQQELNEQMQQTPDQKQQQEMAAKESRLEQDAGSLEQTLSELQELSKDSENLPAEQLAEAAQMMAEQDPAGEMQQAAQQLQQGDMQGAQQSGEQAANTLQQMQQSLSGAQQQMRQNNSREIMQALRRGSHDLLQLSKRQEQLIDQSGNLSRNSPEFGETADRQQEIMSGLQRVTENLYEVAQKSFAVTPEVARSLGQAMSGMEQSISGLEAQNGRSAAKSQSDAMQGLDRAVAGLRQSMQAMNGSGSPGGMSLEDFMKGLQQLAGQQQGLNQMTQQFGPGSQGQVPGPGDLGRLAAQQATVQKSLQQLLEEFGNRGEILGRLDETVRDMDEVVKELQQQQVQRPTLERQQRILSRMLDAQRSLQERDHSKERQAETGKTYRALDPGKLPADLGERKSKIQEDLLRALQESYSRDYRELIRRYFEELASQQQATTPSSQ